MYIERDTIFVLRLEESLPSQLVFTPYTYIHKYKTTVPPRAAPTLPGRCRKVACDKNFRLIKS